MRILVINVGSSSVKLSVTDMPAGALLFKAELALGGTSAADVLRSIPALLRKGEVDGIEAVGHRVAHGADRFREATRLDDAAIAWIESMNVLAPLHNPPALEGIRIARASWPQLPQVAVFDTAFHADMPPEATAYAIPQAWRGAGIRRFGFHGTSHKYVMERVSAAVGVSPRELRIVSCHLGNGASVCAIERGRSIDTSMGMTPLEGLVMGSRSGDVDPGLVAHVHRTLGLSVEAIEDALYRESGLAGLSGRGNDLRDIEAAAAQGDSASQLALTVYAYRARKYIGAYAAAMGGVDVLAFTGGIGENSASMRRRICDRLEFLGLRLDEDTNVALRLREFEAAEIQHANSRVRVIVTQAREQWMIAREVHRLLSARRAPVAELASIPVAVSARHVHITQEAVEALFGRGYRLRRARDLSQPGFWAAEESVDLVGPRNRIKGVRILGPCRLANQVEVSMTDAFALGIDTPVRLSGDLEGTPYIRLEGPAGGIRTDGLIVARRHIHIGAEEAARCGLDDRDLVDVELGNGPRATVFRDVTVRVGATVRLEMHIDTDEANAAGIAHGGEGALMAAGCSARVLHCHARADDSPPHLASPKGATHDPRVAVEQAGFGVADHHGHAGAGGRRGIR